MRYRLKILITASAFLCVLLAQAAPAAESCVKTLYIDGVQIDQKTADKGLTWPYDRITIGAEGDRWYLYNEYVGKMDEFAIYKGVLGANRIKAHYDANSNYTNYKNEVQTDAPLLWLKFDDATTNNGDTAKTSGSIGIDGAYISTGVGNITKTLPGIAAESNAIVFPGREPDANGNCVDVWDANGDFSSDLEGDVTIELWVNFTDTNDYPRFFQHNSGFDANHQGGYGVMVDNPLQPDPNIGIIGGGTTNTVELASDINDGQWHHIVVTYNSTYALPETGPYFDEVMADDPCLYLRFGDDPNGRKDSSGNNYYVGYNPGASVQKTAGGMGNSIYLNGASGGEGANCDVYAANQTTKPAYSDIGDTYAFAPSDITFEMWIKSLPPGQPQMSQYGLFFQQIGAYTKEPNAPGLGNDSNNLRVLGGTEWWYPGVATPLDQQWHQLVVTYDEQYGGDPNSMKIQLYKDGALIGEKVETDNNTPTQACLGPELCHIVIGAANDRGYAYSTFAGYVDEFAIYKGVLSAERVLIHYAAWQVENCAEAIDRAYGPVGDINKDCKVDFADFAGFALSWRQCTDPCDANCVLNW